jgi:hypothetical protein
VFARFLDVKKGGRYIYKLSDGMLALFEGAELVRDLLAGIAGAVGGAAGGALTQKLLSNGVGRA